MRNQGVVTICSCVGGGPMERLARALSKRGVNAEVYSMFSPEHWRGLMASGKTGRVKARLGAFFWFPLKTVSTAFSKNGPVVATTNPFFLPFFMVASRVIHRKPVVALLYDLYPDALEGGGVVRSSGAIARVAVAMNRLVMRMADGVVFIGDRMAMRAKGRYGSPRREMLAFTGASRSEFLGSAPTGRFRADSSLLLSYVGNLGKVHDWETVAAAFPEFLSSRCRFVCAASGPGVTRWQEALTPRMSEKVDFTGPLDDESWRDLLADTDVAIVTLRDSAVHTSVPSKLFSAMAAGCAIVAVAPAESDLAEIVATTGCGEVAAPRDTAELVRVLERLRDNPKELDRRKQASLSAVSESFDMPILAKQWQEFLESIQATNRGSFLYRTVKRAADVTVAGLLLLVGSPLVVAVAGAIRVSMGSPVLFKQERPGIEGRPFKLYKFRTMRHRIKGEVGADADAARLTRLGRFLRATSIDELPTLWNVLKGDMSLVGPRPLLIRYLGRYTPHQARRHEVKPGITGWAQVNGRNAISWEEKFEHDVWYVDNRSLLLDFRILAMTALGVFKREGISSADHATMPEFMGSNAVEARGNTREEANA